jgi:mannose-6-phosphate isomerase-like protein (cupin superfamily)
MADITVKRIEELERHTGPNEIPGIAFLRAAKSLGVSAWGMNVLQLAPHATGYPEHEHLSDGQEEVYVLLRGAATLKADGHEWRMEPGTFLRVGPHEKRKIVTGETGATVLALGGTPGKAYVPRG